MVMTVTQYHAVQRNSSDQPEWGRKHPWFRQLPRVEKLDATRREELHAAWIYDREAYDAQMRHLLGLV